MVLDRPFAFLLALPFAIALVGLATEFVRPRRARGQSRLHDHLLAAQKQT
jgi:hypothetical protein